MSNHAGEQALEAVVSATTESDTSRRDRRTSATLDELHVILVFGW